MTVAIGLIRDESNEVAPNKGSRVEVQPLGENLVDTIDKDQGTDHDASEPTDTNSVESALSTSGALSSS